MEGCKGIWNIPCDVALPCATQNEIDGESAAALVKNGVKYYLTSCDQVENKLTAQVCEQLTYSEKIKILDLPFVEVVFDNNLTPE